MSILTFLLIACGLYALAVPLSRTLRNLHLGLPEMPSLALAIPVKGIAKDGIHLYGEGGEKKALARVYKLAGLDHHSMEANTRIAQHRARQAFLDTISDTKATIRMITVRLNRAQKMAESGQESYDEKVIRETGTLSRDLMQEIRGKWNHSFLESGVYENHHYIISEAPNADRLDEVEAALETSMSDYRPELLRAAESPEQFDPLRSPLAPIIAMVRADPAQVPYVPPGGECADILVSDSMEHLPSTRAGGGGRMILRSGEKKSHMAIVGLKGIGDRLAENTLINCMKAPGEIAICQIYQTVSRVRGSAQLAHEFRIQRGLAEEKNVLQSGALDNIQTAMEITAGEHFTRVKATLSHYSACIAARGRDEDDLRKVTHHLERELTTGGVTPVREGRALIPAFFSCLPHISTFPRMYRLLSSAPASWMIPQTSPAGLKRSDWSESPLVHFLSTDGNTYGFSPHISEEQEAVGHMVVVAPTGVGKTTFLSFLSTFVLGMDERAKVWIFDRHNGTEIFTQAARGEYIAFESEDGSHKGMNPFHLQDNEINRAFIRLWLAGLVGNPNEEDEQDIAQAVAIAYGDLKAQDRSLRNVYSAAFSQDGNARKKLQAWIKDDQYGKHFNAPYTEDHYTGRGGIMGGNARLTAYDCTTAFEDPKLAPPLISLLMHRIRELSSTTGDPTLIYIDETKAMLANQQFAHGFERILQEGRKLRQVCVCCFQTPESIIQTGTKSMILEQCQTAVLMRNTKSTREAYKAFHLNSAEEDFVLGRTHKDLPRAALIRKAGGESVILNIDLARLGKYMKIFASGRESVLEMREAIQEEGVRKGMIRYLESG